jgi:hypothetical protein
MNQKEIEIELEKKIKEHLEGDNIEPHRAGSMLEFEGLEIHLIVGEEPDALYFLADIVARKTPKGKLMWNLTKPVLQFKNKEAYLKSLKESNA